MSDKEKLTQVINLLKVYTVADATKMTTKELWSMLENEPDKFADLEEKTEKSIAKQKRKDERESFRTSYNEYLNSKGLSKSPANEYKYLKDKIDNKIPLSSYEKNEYEALQEIRDVNGGSLENIKAGNKTLEDLLEGDERIKKSNENSEIRRKDNQELIVEYVRKGLEQCKSVEEKTRWLQQFDLRTQKTIVKSLMSAKQEKLGNETKNFLESISLEEGFDIIIMFALGKDTDKDNGVVAGNASKNIHQRLKKNGQSVEGLERHLKNNVIPVVHQDIAGHIGLAGAETGDKDFIGQINKAIANRDDAVDVFKVSNALIANSNEVADEIKQFYAQNSIVVLNTQQERDAQAQDLTSYKNKSFDAGVASGLEIVSKSSDADSSYKTSSSSNTYVTESVTSTPQQTDSVRYASESPVVQDTSEKIILSNSSLSRNEAIKLFKEMTPQEQAELLISLPDNQLGKLPVALCENFPNLIPVFVNKGKGPDIISQCSNSGTITETIKCMQHGGSEIRKQLYALIADAPQFFAKSTQEWASNTIYANQDKADIPKKSINFRS